MIRSITGIVQGKDEQSVVIETAGLGFRVFSNPRTLSHMPDVGHEATLHTHLHVRDGGIDFYGFRDVDDLRFFELLIMVSGVGPRSALSVLRVAEVSKLAAAIAEGRADLLIQASGIGRRTAERIILDLKGKVSAKESAETVKSMEFDEDILEALVGLGYRRGDAKAALGKIGTDIAGTDVRLKAALKILSGA